MGNKPRTQKPLGLHLEYNVKEGMYETMENGLLYALPHSLLDSLKKDFTYNNSVEQWYNKLFPVDKKKVIVLNKPDEDLSYSDGEFN